MQFILGKPILIKKEHHNVERGHISVLRGS